MTREHAIRRLKQEAQGLKPELPEHGLLLFLSEAPIQQVETRLMKQMAWPLFDASGRRVELPADCNGKTVWVGFVDLDPGARWSHSAMWVFIPSDGTPVFTQPTNLCWHPNQPAGFIRFELVEQGSSSDLSE